MGTVVGLFESKDKAQRAVEALRRAGFRDEDISLVMRDRRESTTAATEASHLETEAGTGGGVAAGAVGGGLLGSLAGLAVGVVRWPSPASARSWPPDRSRRSSPEARSARRRAVSSARWSRPASPRRKPGITRPASSAGAVLLTVHAPESREDEARSILRQSGMRDLHEHRNQWAGNPDDTSDPLPRGAIIWLHGRRTRTMGIRRRSIRRWRARRAVARRAPSSEGPSATRSARASARWPAPPSAAARRGVRQL